MKMDLMSVMVDDQAKALAFYTDVLGFEKMVDVPVGEYRWLTVSAKGAPGMQLLLEPTAHRAAKQFQAALKADGVPAVSFLSEDIDAEHAALVAKGVVFKQPPTDIGPVKIAVFDDTCGNWIQLRQLKF
jgi:catechol 2,3-dioxygenase-like lactoylglutathione lyase family enzyme